MDALPGLSQDAKPERKIIKEGMPGHACGHHLFGAGSIAAAVAVKNWLIETGTTGTIRLYGTPAEEGGSGKVYMVRAGLFDDVDIVMHWHPSDRNDASPASSLANKSAKFRFYGIAAHAAAAPEKGRSALDAVESMNFMVNLMREHLPEPARIHYIITEGGAAPNIVPEYAEVYYYARHTRRDEVIDVFDRIVDAAKGAAIGTGTTMDYEIISGVHELLHVESLQRRVHRNLEKIGGYIYNDEEKAFAEKISKIRVFTDSTGKMNKSLIDVSGSILMISQFTLAANTKRGNRPDFKKARHPDEAKDIFDYLVKTIKNKAIPVKTGVFGADMKLKTVNLGPVTIPLEYD